MKTKFFLLLSILILTKQTFSQNFDSAKVLESLDFQVMVATSVSGLLDKNRQDGSISIFSCSSLFGLESTKLKNDLTYFSIFSIKVNCNLWYIIGYAPYIDESGFKNKAYLAIYKRQFGQEDSIISKIISKERLYPQNNIYTEKIAVENFEFIIEKYFYIKKLVLPDKNYYNFEYSYYTFDDCDHPNLKK